jgi:protein-L-isoaspartate O-methyltransferase
MSTLETWKYLQDGNYFGKHRLYNKFETEIPEYVNVNDIKGKKVVEIGGGYGRHTVFLAKHAEIVYMIEVSRTIIEKAYNFIKSKNLYNVRFFEPTSYDTGIPYGIDFVYEYLVFQHIEPALTKRYIDVLYEKLNIGGKMCMQFRIAKNKKDYYPSNQEPTVYHEYDDVIRYFDKMKIETVERRRHGRANFAFVVAKKMR